MHHFSRGHVQDWDNVPLGWDNTWLWPFISNIFFQIQEPCCNSWAQAEIILYHTETYIDCSSKDPDLKIFSIIVACRIRSTVVSKSFSTYLPENTCKYNKPKLICTHEYTSTTPKRMLKIFGFYTKQSSLISGFDFKRKLYWFEMQTRNEPYIISLIEHSCQVKALIQCNWAQAQDNSYFFSHWQWKRLSKFKMWLNWESKFMVS